MVEVMIAVFLLCFTALTFLYAMTQGHRVAGMSGQRLQALHIARDVMEQVRAQKYTSIETIPEINLGNGFKYECLVAAASGFANTKDITVKVSWQDVAGNTLSTIDLCSSATLWIHQ